MGDYVQDADTLSLSASSNVNTGTEDKLFPAFPVCVHKMLRDFQSFLDVIDSMAAP